MMLASPSPLPSHQAALAGRLRRLSTGVLALVALGAAALAALPLLLAYAPDSWLNIWLGNEGANQLQFLQGDLTFAVRLRMAGVTLLPVAISLSLLWQLWCLFGQYRRGVVFSRPALGHLRHFGWLMVALAVVEPLSRALMSVAISLDNPPGQRMLVLTLGSYDYALLLLSLVLVAIARVMAEAARVAEENEQFI
jgi:hypothetical protein